MHVLKDAGAGHLVLPLGVHAFSEVARKDDTLAVTDRQWEAQQFVAIPVSHAVQPALGMFGDDVFRELYLTGAGGGKGWCYSTCNFFISLRLLYTGEFLSRCGRSLVVSSRCFFSRIPYGV